jgi:hypothetical protein
VRRLATSAETTTRRACARAFRVRRATDERRGVRVNDRGRPSREDDDLGVRPILVSPIDSTAEDLRNHCTSGRGVGGGRFPSRAPARHLTRAQRRAHRAHARDARAVTEERASKRGGRRRRRRFAPARVRRPRRSGGDLGARGRRSSRGSGRESVQ